MSMYPDMYGFSGMEGLGQMEDALIMFLGIYLVILLLASIYSIVVYVLHSLGLFSIAKRRGIRHPWLAWIPVANVWVLGSISDQYQYVAKGMVRNRRKVLLGLTIATYALLIPFWIVYFSFLGQFVSSTFQGMAPADILAPAMLLLLISLVMLVVAVIQTVFAYIAYYDLFTSSRPNSAVVFLVLGILFSFLLPYFVFACRKKDDGMPPRREDPQPVELISEAPVYEQEDTVTEEDFEPEE